MKENKINSLVWFLVALFLLGVLLRSLSGKDWRNFRFWTWFSKSDSAIGKTESNSWDDSISDEDFIIYTFDSDEIENLDINTVSETLKVISSPDQDDIKVCIQNKADVRSIFNVSKKGSTLVLERKKNNKIYIHGFNELEVLVKLPDNIYSFAQINSVSGSILIEDLKARKTEVNNVSGRIEIENCEGKLKTGNVSGRTVISLDKLKNNITAESVSGKIEINLPEESDFTADFETVSGSVKADFEKHGKKEGTISNGSRTYDLQFETVSGSIEVNKN